MDDAGDAVLRYPVHARLEKYLVIKQAMATLRNAWNNHKSIPTITENRSPDYKFKRRFSVSIPQKGVYRHRPGFLLINTRSSLSSRHLQLSSTHHHSKLQQALGWHHVSRRWQ
ncbi:hypothetical protein TNCV_2058361 [Trichonephila clavipes]|nr:hypothetical protein TNCV_2058361 [Trichonephila clavipes]